MKSKIDTQMETGYCMIFSNHEKNDYFGNDGYDGKSLTFS